MLRRPLLLILLIATTTVAAAGCGSDDETSASTPAPVSTPRTTTATETRTADTTPKTTPAHAKTTSTGSATAKPSKGRIVTPKKPTQKPVPLSEVRKREAAVKRARAACLANGKLKSSLGLPCELFRVQARRRRSAGETGNRIPECPKGKLRVNGGPCLRK